VKTRLRTRLVERTQWTLREVDALLVPTTQIPARALAGIDRGFEVYLDHNTRYNRNTGLGNFLNLCGLSVPCGFTRLGLPIGLMIYARPFREDLALRVASAYEQATDWHIRHPDLSWTTKRKERVR
jgi:aspartyl-tRNA(Asn)/glutamyl-tRNA(Gln) amidotransferase subunit A